jgi:dienelactone hydrolase
MAGVVLFHSSLGLRPVEGAAAAMLRADGHDVLLPDLYAGRTADTLAAGLALMDQIGWPTIVGRAESALVDMPPDAVLAGLSMGAGVVGAVWPERPNARAVILLHAPAPIPDSALPGTAVSLHAAADDPFTPADAVEEWQSKAAEQRLVWTVFRYPGVGHFFTDESSPDYDARAAQSAWTRVRSLLTGVK